MSEGTFGTARRHPVKEQDTAYRDDYQRDRDRVLYSSAFRRLAGVAQVAAVNEQLVLPLYDPGADTYLSAVYRTGPLMLHALRRGIGDDAFFRVLPIWQNLHRGGNASWPEFEQLAQRVSGVDLDDFFKAWTRSTTIPADRYLYPGLLRP